MITQNSTPDLLQIADDINRYIESASMHLSMAREWMRVLRREIKKKNVHSRKKPAKRGAKR